MKVIRYSKAFRIQAVREVESGETCAEAVGRKYGIRGHGTVNRWVRQLGSGKYGKIIRVEKADEMKPLQYRDFPLLKGGKMRVDATRPEGGGTGHTIRVCQMQAIPVATKAIGFASQHLTKEAQIRHGE
jgi:hypothetical protein